MIYFIPSWYSSEGWLENEQVWYSDSFSSEFDDTVKQLQLFHRSKLMPCCALVLGHSPNLRHFLHRQSILNVPYWSLFDAIQCVEREKTVVFSLHNLAWPEGAEFVYTPRGVNAMWKGALFARVDFGHDGNPIEVELFKNGTISRKNYYDDRGFISRTVLYADGEENYEQYLDEKGIWKLCRFFSDGHVVINPKSNYYTIRFSGRTELKNFKNMSYSCLNAVIEEVLSAYVRHTMPEDIFCAAVHPLHAPVLKSVLTGHKFILSFFSRRGYFSKNKEVTSLRECAAAIVADDVAGSSQLKRMKKNSTKLITEIVPFDTRLDFSISQQQKVKIILLAVDGISKEMFQSSLSALAQYTQKDSSVRIHLMTRKSGTEVCDVLRQMAKAALVTAKQDSNLVGEPGPDGENGEFSPRILAENCADELSLTRTLRKARMVIDLSKKPDIFLQVSCVSIGIPQIALRENNYVVDGKNGAVVSSPEQMLPVLSLYLNHLNKWNEAAVFSHELGKNYSSDHQKKQWMEVIHALEQN